MDALEAIKTRRSIRSFSDKAIPKEAISSIIDCARMAPTAMNLQPWDFVVVTEKDTLKKIADITDHGKFIAQAAACVAVCCKNTTYFLEDCSAATQSIMVAANSLGIGSCWVAGHTKPYCDEIKALLGIPEDHRLVSLVPLGYAASKTESPPKRAISEVLHWENF